MALKPQVLLYRLEACEVSALFLLTWRSARARPLRPVRWSCAAKAVQLGVVPEYIRLFTYAVDTCQRFPASLTVKVLRVAFRGRAAAFSDHSQPAPQERDGFRFFAVAMQDLVGTATQHIVAILNPAELRMSFKTDL